MANRQCADRPRRGIGIAGQIVITADVAEHGIRLDVVKLPEAKRVVLLILMAWKDKERFQKNANLYSIPGKSIH